MVGFLADISLAFVFAFRPSIQNIEITKTTAKVQSIQGLAVFNHSEPVML